MSQHTQQVPLLNMFVGNFEGKSRPKIAKKEWLYPVGILSFPVIAGNEPRKKIGELPWIHGATNGSMELPMDPWSYLKRTAKAATNGGFQVRNLRNLQGAPIFRGELLVSGRVDFGDRQFLRYFPHRTYCFCGCRIVDSYLNIGE